MFQHSFNRPLIQNVALRQTDLTAIGLKVPHYGSFTFCLYSTLQPNPKYRCQYPHHVLNESNYSKEASRVLLYDLLDYLSRGTLIETKTLMTFAYDPIFRGKALRAQVSSHVTKQTSNPIVLIPCRKKGNCC